MLTDRRTDGPTDRPNNQSTNQPTNQPTNQLNNQPTNQPTNQSNQPTPGSGVLLEKICASGNEIYCILWNPMVDNSLSFFLILRHINPLHPSTSRYISILIWHLRFDLPRGIFLSHLVTKTLLTCLTTSCKIGVLEK